MRQITKFYIACVCVGSIATVGAMYLLQPGLSHADAQTLSFLSALAVVSEMLAFVLAREARGSVAFIPYLATVVLVPSWASVAAVVVVKWVMESLARIDRRKALFNACAHGLTLAVAIGVYRGFGGTSLLGVPIQSLSGVTGLLGLPAVIAFAAAFLANAVFVSVAMALESGDSFRVVLRENSVAAIGADLLSAPVVFVFAWVYASFGPMAAAVAWVPFLGLRHVTRLNAELQRTNEELLQLMVKSIEARDPYTSGHSRRVSKYAVAIARALGLGSRETRNVTTAALLHDVGKIYEKYAPILSKPGRLTAEEWATMQEHPVDGANLVNTITRMRDLVPAVRHHHENWDGTGYPDGISGNSIPLASRIIMFADTIDAMTSERPYRGALTEIEVRAEVVKCRGKQFDPSIADRLLAAGIWHTLFEQPKSAAVRPLLALVQDRETA